MKNIKQMEQGIPVDATGRLYVFVDRNEGGTPSHPYLLQITRNTEDAAVTSPIIRTYREQNTCAPLFFKSVLSDVKKDCAQNNTVLRRLVLWSHGTGWLPEGTVFNELEEEGDEEEEAPIPQFSFGSDSTPPSVETASQKEMDIKDLARALGGEHFDLLILDACFMGGVEVAYELRNSCDYLLASPSEIVSTGFPYAAITVDLVAAEPRPFSIAEKFYEHYQNQKNALQSAAVSVIETAYLHELASSMQPMYENYFLRETDTEIESFFQYRNL